MYKLAHHLHHRNVNIGVWSGLSMHPLEHLLYFSGVLVHWVIASHPIHAMFHLFHLGFSPAAGHSGYDRIGAEGGKGVTIGAYMHYLHHQYFECNYGGDGLPIIDKLMGTFHDGSRESHERMNRRLKERRWAKQEQGAE
jgi:sterol desaturase/sphingolipid hydroxylase (fatty acid hydroxylase superfamily)